MNAIIFYWNHFVYCNFYLILENDDDNKEPKEPIELPLVNRSEWNAVNPKEGVDKLKLPVEMIIICHTVGSECHSKSECATIVKNIQTFHMSDENTNPKTNFSDIGFNFLIGGDGNIYEGR